MDDEQNASETDLIRAWLANHDVECPVCAYNLRTSISQTCPECGAHLELRVGSADLRLGAWIVSLMGLALPLGFVGIYSAIMFLPVLGVRGPATWFLLPLGIIAAYLVPLVLLIRRRRKFWKKSRRAQWLAAVGYLVFGVAMLCLGPLIAYVAFFLG